jgi:hypothetical protein
MPDRRQVLFIQGGGDKVHDEWDAKLVDSLANGLGAGYEVRYPRMPSEGDPSYARWAPVITHEMAALSDGGIVVGHSAARTRPSAQRRSERGCRRDQAVDARVSGARVCTALSPGTAVTDPPPRSS